ncbi:Vacuolar protein-sorting-associated protein 33 [Marasmius sp. AFHP31]|nr:Vacuolar protein-sorting-associated protein 33 [Marasmius sp. AFHP31]
MSSTEGQSSTPDNDQALDTSILREINKRGLVDALNAVNGAKTLVLDPNLAGPLGLVTEVALLKHHGVDKMFWLEAGPLTLSTPNVVYLCRPAIRYVKIIADHIKRHAKESLRYNYTILLVPRTSTLVTRLLEEEGVLGDVTISSYNLQLIPLAEDVVSLEHESAFKDLWVDGDETAIYDSAQALITLQKMYGTFPRMLGKGDHAARLIKLVQTYLPQSRNASTSDALSGLSDKMDSLIVLDRRIDMITPLLTQLTYEGLIDELLGIKNSHVELPASLITPPQPNAGAPSTSGAAAAPAPSTPNPLRKENKKKFHLTSTDTLFTEIRDLNFSHVGKKLNQVARRLDEDYKASRQAKTIPQLRDVVGKLGGLQSEHQSLRIHTGLSELLVPMTRTDQFNKSLEIQQNLLASYNVSEQLTAIEDLIAQGAEMEIVVRLACLASITAGGIKNKVLENIKREILQAYGYNFLPLLLSLSTPSLPVLLSNPPPANPPELAAAAKFPFSALRKSLRLLIDDDAESLSGVENDISFVYSGWAPISIRLVQCVAQKGGVLSNPAEKERFGTQTGANEERGSEKVQAHPIIGWKGFEDVMALIPGETADVNMKDPAAGPILSRPADRTTTTVVFFLGGCTYTEIAALRWVARQHEGRKFLIATTGITPMFSNTPTWNASHETYVDVSPADVIEEGHHEWCLLTENSIIDLSVSQLTEEHDYKDAPLLTRGAHLLFPSSYATQYGVFGKILACRLRDKSFSFNDPRLYMNANAPFSAVVCGVQGSGKSHTVSVMLENLLIQDCNSIGSLKKPLCGLVLHFGEGGTGASPCEAAWLAASDRVGIKAPRGVYSSVARKGKVSVEPLLFEEGDLDAQTFLSMMAVGTSESAPLYIQILLSILRDMGETFSYPRFLTELEKSKKNFNPAQLSGLEQRLSLLKSFLRSKKAPANSPRFVPGELTIVDLSDPFIDPGSACGIFEVITRLFVRAKVDTGKFLLLDEAHKYLSARGSSPLTQSLLSLMRLQRHLAMRIIISTQEPTVIPSVILDLCSVAVLHRFSSPSWWEHLVKHVSADFADGNNAFDEVVKLQAMILVPSGLGTFGTAELKTPPALERFGRKYLIVKTRKRVTFDGGASVLVL